MVTQQVTDTDDMPFGDDLEELNFDDDENEGEDDAASVAVETSAEALGEESTAGASDLDAELKALLAEQAALEETVRKHKETEEKIKQLNREKERREQDIKEYTCPKCNYYHIETRVERPARTSGSGRGRGSGKAFPDNLRNVSAAVVAELRLQGANQSVIGKKLAETFPEVYEDASNAGVRWGTVAGQILKSGSGAWANVTGFETTVETYSERSMTELEAMMQMLGPKLTTEESALVEQVASL